MGNSGAIEDSKVILVNRCFSVGDSGSIEGCRVHYLIGVSFGVIVGL